jgi:hypothetical protein
MKLFENLPEQSVVFLWWRSRGFLHLKNAKLSEGSSRKYLYFESVENFFKGFEKFFVRKISK